MFGTRLTAVCLLGLLLTTDAYRYSRLEGVLPNFHSYDTIDTDPSINESGWTVPLSDTFTAFGYSTTTVKIFDTGYVALDAGMDRFNIEDRTSIFLRRFPFVSADWIKDIPTYGNLVAFRIADSSTRHLQHDLDRINAEVNRFLEQYTETWRCSSALIVTWNIYSLANPTVVYDKTQAVLASGEDGTDYVLLLYDTLALASTTLPFAIVNGDYNAAPHAKLAKICGDDISTLTLLPTHSNYQCGNSGIYLIKLADGQECTKTQVEQCAATDTGNLNCVVPPSEPKDTCTEGVYCLLNEAQTAIQLTLEVQYYPFDEVIYIDYLKFIGSGTETQLGNNSVIDYATDAACKKSDLLNPGTSASRDSFTTETSIVDGSPSCGVQVDTAEGTIKYAIAHRDKNQPEVIKDGCFVIYGTCNYRELTRNISTSLDLNDADPPKLVQAKNRTANMEWVNIQGTVITSAEQGDIVYAQICFYPGTTFNLDADPFGMHPIDCYIANNPNFANKALPDTSPYRSVQVISKGCVALASTKSFYFTYSFRKLGNPTKGQEWCVRTGPMEAAKFKVKHGEDSIYMQCYCALCHTSLETACDDSCVASPGRTRRSLADETDYTDDTQSLTAKLDITYTPESDPVQEENVNDCISYTVVYPTLIVLMLLIIIAVGTSIVLLVKMKAGTVSRKY